MNEKYKIFAKIKMKKKKRNEEIISFLLIAALCLPFYKSRFRFSLPLFLFFSVFVLLALFLNFKKNEKINK